MGVLSKFLGAGSADAVAAIGGVVDQLFTSDEERAQGAAIMEKIRQQPELAEKAIGLAQAKSTNWFVAGGRPALLWVSAIGLFMFYVPQYTVAAYLWARVSIQTGELVPYPVTSDGLIQLVGIALGMSGYRMIEKRMGVAR